MIVVCVAADCGAKQAPTGTQINISRQVGACYVCRKTLFDKGGLVAQEPRHNVRWNHCPGWDIFVKLCWGALQNSIGVAIVLKCSALYCPCWSINIGDTMTLS